MPTPPFEHITYADFSGGFSDDLQTGERHIFEKYENFLITNEKKAYSREGSALIGGSNFLTAVKAYAPTGDLINYQKDTNLLIRAKDKIFYNQGATFSTGTWSALSGPDGNASLPGMGNFASVTWDEYNNHTYFVAWDSFAAKTASPMKVYQADDGSYKLRNAGLPKFPNNLDQATLISVLGQAVALVNDLRAQMQHHFNNDGGVDHTIVHTADFGTAIGIYSANWPDGVYGTLNIIYNLYLKLRTNYTVHIEDARLTSTEEVYAVSRYHVYGNTWRFGNFHLKPLAYPLVADSPLQSLFNIADLLNELRRSWYFHVNAFKWNGDPAAGPPGTNSTVARNLHGGATIYAPSAPAINYAPAPVIANGLQPLYDWMTQIQLSANTHATSVPVHNSMDLTFSVPTISSPEQLLLLYYKSIFFFFEHWRNNSVHLAAAHPDDREKHYPHTTTSDDSDSLFAIDTYIFALIQYSNLQTSAGNSFSPTTAPVGRIDEKESLYLINPEVNLSHATAMVKNMMYLQCCWGMHAANTTRHSSVFNFSVAGTLLAKEFQDPFISYPSGGLGFVSGTTTTMPDFTFEIEQRGYAFMYRNKYRTQAGFEYETLGTPYQFRATGAPDGMTKVFFPKPMYAQLKTTGQWTLQEAIHGPNSQNIATVSITGLAALPTTENWPTDTAMVDIYRAGKGDATYRLIGSIAHNVGFFVDTTDESLLQNAVLPALYTTGNDISYDPPPQSRCFAIVNDYGYFGGTTEVALGDIQTFPKRLRQSLNGQVDACPSDFYTDLASDIQTIGSARGYPIVVCSRGVYRIDGSFDDFGRGGMNPVRISDTVGGIGPNAGATLNDRFYWAGPSGIYVTDGFQVVKLSMHLDKSFVALLQAGATARMKIKATADRTNQRVLWTVTDPTGYAQAVWVLDVRHSTEARGSFQRLSNGTSFAPTAIAVFKDTLYRGDEDGFVFVHADGLTSDPKIDRGTHTLTGSTLAIPYQLRTAPDMLGYTHLRKWAPYAEFEFANLGNLSLQVSSINDKNAANLRPLNPIRYRGGYQGEISENRKFPGGAAGGTSGGLRCKSKQLDLQPANIILVSSDLDRTKCHILGTALSLDTVEMDGSTPSTAQFPSDCVDQFISIEDDGYVTQYLITAQPSPTTLTLAVAPPASGASRKWVLRGVPKTERVQINQMSVWFFPMTQVDHPSSGVTGGNS